MLIIDTSYDLRGHAGRTLSPRGHDRLSLARISHEQKAAAVLAHVLVHHRHVVECARRLLRLGVFLGLVLELVHESMVLHFHLLSIAGAAFDGVLHHRLTFELLRPARHGH